MGRATDRLQIRPKGYWFEMVLYLQASRENRVPQGRCRNLRDRTNEQNAAEIAAALESLGFNKIDEQTNLRRQ